LVEGSVSGERRKEIGYGYSPSQIKEALRASNEGAFEL
jgi:hypothetical protein